METPIYKSKKLFQEPATPFTAFKNGDFIIKDREESQSLDHFKETEKMKKRGTISTLIDISNPDLWLCEVTDYFKTNLLPVYIANPFPNGMFIHMMDWDLHREHKVHSSQACVEIFKIQNEFRMNFYRFDPRGTIGPENSVEKLTLESSYYIKSDGSIREKYMRDYKDKDIRKCLRKINAVFLGKLQAFFEFLLTCNTLKSHLTPTDIPLEKEELQSKSFKYRGDIHKILYIKETPRIIEAGRSLKSTGQLPKRYHQVRGHMCKNHITGHTWFRKGHPRGNKKIGEVHKVYKIKDSI